MVDKEIQKLQKEKQFQNTISCINKLNIEIQNAITRKIILVLEET